ncbi:MAG: hypothetical protein ACREO1_15080 [Arenimonas sp.]
MKIAPIMFCASLAIFFATIATSQRNPELEKPVQVPLDFSGIDTLEVLAGQGVNISLRNDVKPTMSYGNKYYNNRDEDNAELKAVRLGNKLVISMEDVHGYGNLEIVMPSSVRRLIVDQVNIEANVNDVSLDMQVSGSLNWNGAAHSLRIRDSRIYKSGCKDECVSYFTIRKGQIDELSLETLKGVVTLEASEQLKSTHLLLGPDAALSVNHVESLKSIQISDFPAQQMTPYTGGKQAPTR